MIKRRIYQYLKNISFKNKILVKTHKNFCKIFYFKKERIFRKIADNKLGIERVLSDYQGLTWYIKRLNKNKKKIIKKFVKNKNFSYLDTFQIDGFQAKSWDSLEKNYKKIKKVYFQYKRVFPKNKYTSIHGDLTLDNIIFKKKEIFIIDWEFFGSKKNFYGYDLAYLFLSSLCLPFVSKKKYSLVDEKLFISLWRMLKELNVDRQIIDDPFYFFEKNIKKDRLLKKNYLLSKSKFFPFLVKSSYKKKICKLINDI